MYIVDIYCIIVYCRYVIVEDIVEDFYKQSLFLIGYYRYIK